jgi:AraC-like DNA-binding protein
MAIATADTRGILNPQRGAEHFTLTRHAPRPEVADRIERHWIVRWDLRGRSPFTQDVLPHPCVNLVFEGGEGRVYGVVRHRFSRRLEGFGTAVGTKFRPGAFAAFVDIPMSRLVERSVTVEEAFGASGARLQREVAGLADDADQVAAVERFIAARMPADDDGFALVSAIVADMLRLPPGARVEEVAERHGLSERTLQRLFRRYVGLGPKWVLQRYRLHEALEQIDAAGNPDWSRFALDLGYYDQAHFLRDFRAVAGRSPARYAAEARALRSAAA